MHYTKLFYLFLSTFTIPLCAHIFQEAPSDLLIPVIQENWDDTHFDYLVGDWVGCKRVAPDIEQYVRRILWELKSPITFTLRIRKMAERAIYSGMTKYNAFVTAFGQNEYMFISEKWFRKLSEAEKRFLIGHEYMHLHCRHTKTAGLKALGLSALVGLGCGIGSLLFCLTSGLFKNAPEGSVRASFLLGGAALAVSLPFAAAKVSRDHEYEADRESALQLNNVKGGIALMKRFKKIFKVWKEDRSKLWLRQVERKIDKWFSGPFRSHPTDKERIRALEALCE